MKFDRIKKHLLAALILAIPVFLSGCVSGGKTVPNDVAGKDTAVSSVPSSKGANVSVIPSGTGQFILQGNNADDIAGFDLTVTYDSSTLSVPTVTKNTALADAMMAANTNVPGTIRLVLISTKPFSGTVQLATVSFASSKGQGGISITSVSMVNSKGVIVK